MSALENTFRVAIFDQFLEGFARIPRSQQKKVNGFIRKFRADPTSAAINYEKIQNFADKNLRTVRIGDDYRAIVLRPEQGNVFVLLWVDHHDEAMAWAKNKKVEVHPETGGLQVYSLMEADPKIEPVSATPSSTLEPAVPIEPLFAQWSDAQLFSLGVPQLLLSAIREVRDIAGLEQLTSLLPSDAWEALFFLADGEDIDEVQRVLEITNSQSPVDVATALETDASKRRFIVVENDDALAAMLDAPLEKWRIFLHPSQRKLVERSWSGPVRVLGGAGTGKTVVAMHRAAWLLANRFKKNDDRILFTTFTKNLAADIAANLAKLLTNEALRRIEVVHFDKWVADFLNSRGYRYEIDYFKIGSGRLWDLWQQSIDAASDLEFPSSFYREEWDYVVQLQGCISSDEYVRAKRKGRGVRLSRGQRLAIWPVFEEYRNLLEERGLRESADAMRDATSLLQRREAMLGYCSVLVDESQDLSTAAFELIRTMIPEQRADDLFIVGDGHQRIYRRQVTLSKAGINIVGRSRRLRINYRTTDEIRQFAVALLEGLTIDDLDEGQDTAKGYKSLFHGEPPRVEVFSDFTAEVEAIARFVQGGDSNRTCLVARTNSLVEKYTTALETRSISTYRLRRSSAEDRTASGLRVATMHRVKGLEFDRMIIAGVNQGDVPLAMLTQATEDEAVKADIELQERTLLYVATTRARSEVLLTASGTPSPWLSPKPVESQV